MNTLQELKNKIDIYELERVVIIASLKALDQYLEEIKNIVEEFEKKEV